MQLLATLPHGDDTRRPHQLVVASSNSQKVVVHARLLCIGRSRNQFLAFCALGDGLISDKNATR